ncbi:MAG: HAD-IIIC family phosphatase, partial [Ruminococcus sp.]|nr:HAD-IIIC family phosphatase [Ruminococcus sp.]
MKELCYPFDGKYIRKNRKKLKKQLLSDGSQRIKKKIAVLGGSTADDVVFMLELFLLNFGIEPEFYLSEYNKFYEDAMFGTPDLDSFNPDIIYIHTTSRNITMLPDNTSDSPEQIEERLNAQFDYFKQIWINLAKKFACPIIQNNFELPRCRHSGSYDGWGYYGKSAFISRLNVKMSDYARRINGFYINDINYLSAACGLEKWHDTQAWYLYKYAMSLEVIPDLAYSIACIIKSIYGKNKKVIDLDLDNTLWGGVIGDDGQEGIEIGQETAVAQSFSEFQSFIREYKSYGVLLAVCSKNDRENALLGLNHPETVLKPDDFVSIKANWESKDRNIEEAASELNLLPESFVFVDDNPAECAIVESQLNGVSVVNLTSVGS